MRETHTHARWLPRIVAVLMLGVLVAACGGDDGAPADEVTSPAAEESTPSAEMTDAATDVATDAETAGAVGDGQALASEECVAAAEAMTAAAGGMFDPSTADADSQDAVAALERMSEVAPADIQEDFRVLAEALGAYFTALEDAGIDFSDPATFTDPEAAAAIEEAAATLDTAAVQEASDNVEAWFDAECGNPTP